MHRLRVAVVGVGRWGRNHVRVLKELESEGLVSLEAVCDVNAERVRVVAQQFSVPRYFDSIDRMLNSIDLDAAVVATPIHTLYDVARALIDRGLHVLVEKPVAENLEQISKLIDRARVNNVLAVPGYIMRFNPVSRRLREIVANDRFLYMIFRRLSRRPPAARRYSIVLDLTVHDIDLCRYISSADRLELVSVSITRLGEDDVVLLQLRADNTMCIIHTDGLSLAKIREIELIGEHMFVRGNTDDLTIYTRFPDGRYTMEKLVGEEPLKLEDRSFVQKIMGLEVEVPTLHDAYRVMEVVEAIRRIRGSL